MSYNKYDYIRAAGRPVDQSACTQLQPSKIGAGLLVGVVIGIIGLSPVIVKLLIKHKPAGSY